MLRSESGSYSLWREHPGSQWMALLNSMVSSSIVFCITSPLCCCYVCVSFFLRLSTETNNFCLLCPIFASSSVEHHMSLSVLFTLVLSSGGAWTCISCEWIPNEMMSSVCLIFDGLIFQGLTDHSCLPLSSGEHAINSPEPTHGKDFSLTFKQCTVDQSL